MLKLMRFLKHTALKFRQKMENIRKNNPKVFDISAKAVECLFILFTTFTPYFLSSPFSSMLVVLFCTFNMAFLWATLTNREERNTRKITEEKDREISRLKQEADRLKATLDDEYEDMFFKVEEENISFINLESKFQHRVAHRVKMNIAKMQYQSIGVVANDVISFLSESLNSLEVILSAVSGHKICASIKLCATENTVVTCARGRNNEENRGGENSVISLNQKAVEIIKNYAYNYIINLKKQFFAQGDLHNLHNPVRRGDKFYCEYINYYNNFKSTIIIPIRTSNFAGNRQEGNDYDISGLVCIDCDSKVPDWNKNVTESTCYHILAGYADNIYLLIAAYMQKSKYNDRKKKQYSNRRKKQRGKRYTSELGSGFISGENENV